MGAIDDRSIHASVIYKIPFWCRAKRRTLGTQLEFVDENGAIRLKILCQVQRSDPAAGFGLVKIKPVRTGTPRRLNDAIELHRRGLDFADALHWTCSVHCREFVSFDDRRFVRRAPPMKRVPHVVLAK